MMITLLTLAQLHAASLTGTGISRELAALRARQVSAVRYELKLDVTRRDTAYGHARLRFERKGGGDVIVDFRGPSYANVMVNGATVTPRAENGHLVLPASALRNGENEASMDF